MKILLMLLAVNCAGTVDKRVDKLLDAMEKVESGGRPRAVGDNGRSRGPLQIQQGYWNEGAKKAGVKYVYHEKVWDRNCSRTVVKGYWKRYCPNALNRGDCETLARVHNGGPNGHKKQATVKYWKAVRSKMR